MTRFSSVTLGWALLSTGLLLSGCAMWGETQKPQAAPAADQCAVELKPATGASKVGHLDLPKDANVSYVLEKTGAHRKYSRVKIELHRKLDSGEWINMKIDYDITHKKVDPLHDYHVMPGDRLVVAEDQSSGLDDLMKDPKGILGGVFGS
jgi:hypothetical protein